MLLADVKTKYILNGFPYLGKDHHRSHDIPLGTYITLEIMKPYYKWGINVTTDSFFTSILLANRLLEQKITLIGTCKINTQELPPICHKIDKTIRLYTSKHFQSGKLLLSLYKCKPNKNVVLLSSKHKFITINNSKKKKN